MTAPRDVLSAETVLAGLRTRYVGRKTIYLPSVTSTMDVACREARLGAPEGTIVLADHQTAGRGRFQRRWVSPPGQSIHLSVVLRPGLDRLLCLGQVASLAVVRAAQRATGLEPQIKWPNDVMVGGRKLAGILIDSTMKNGGVDYVVMGIGVNVSLDPSGQPEIAGIATSLSQELGRPVSRLAVLQALLVEIEGLYERVRAGQSLVGEWRRHVSTLGRRVRVTWPGDSPKKALVEEGIAEGVDDEGALLLRRDDGTVARLIAGEVSLGAGPGG